MKKIFFYAVCVFSMAAPLTQVAHANAQTETDDMNMSGSAVKIINMYPGMWKGWKDGCFNCYKPLASDKPRSKTKKTGKAKSKKGVQLPKSVRRGYCECNCKPPTKKKTKNKSFDKVPLISDEKLKKINEEIKKLEAESEEVFSKETIKP